MKMAPNLMLTKIRKNGLLSSLSMLVFTLGLADNALAASAANDGDGTMTVSPTSVAANSTGDTFSFVFAGPNNKPWNSGAQITVLVPAGWNAPTTAAGAGRCRGCG